MDNSTAIKDLEAKIFHWGNEGLDKKKDKWTLSSEEVRLLIEDLTLRNVQAVEIAGLNKEIVKAQDNYQELCDSYPCGYLALGEDCRIREANEAIANSLEVDRPDLLNMRFDQFVSPDSQDDFRAYFELLLRARSRQTQSMLLKTTSGSIFKTQISGVGILDSEKKSCLCRLVISVTPDESKPESMAEIAQVDHIKDYIRQRLCDSLMQECQSPVRAPEISGVPQLEAVASR
jgi:PAS domain S-box-containing protein